ncbi:MAG: hypothetical protein AB1847_15575 [bacterium]
MFLKRMDRFPAIITSISFFFRFLVPSVLIASVLIAFVFIPSVLLIPSVSEASWKICTIQSLNHFNYYYSIHSIALDDQECVHLAYGDGAGNLNHLRSLDRENYLVWLAEEIHDVNEVNGFAALALDTSNNPHFCYCSYDGHLIYAHKKGGKWASHIIDDSKNINPSASIGMDSQGVVHISYYDARQKRLKYVTFNESKRESIDEFEFVSEVVDDSEGAGTESSLALDSAGNVHIAYYDKVQQNLKYACKTEGKDWSMETVDSDGNIGYSPSLAVDGDGRPCISYCDWTNRNLKYAFRSGEEWITETVDGSPDKTTEKTGDFTALALDHKGRPHISYFSQTAHALMYAAHDGKTWQIQVVNRDEDIEGPTSLALDSSGQAHIIYYNYTTNSLKYAISKESTQPAERKSIQPAQGDARTLSIGCFLSAVKIL